MQRGLSAWGIQIGSFAAGWAPFVLKCFKLFHLHTGEANSYYPRGPIMGKGNSPNLRNGQDREVCVPGAFKLDHLQPFAPIKFWELQDLPFPILALWGNKNWPPQYKGEKVGKFERQEWLSRLQMVQFECPRHWNPSVLTILGVARSPLSHIGPLG